MENKLEKILCESTFKKNTSVLKNINTEKCQNLFVNLVKFLRNQ